MRRARPFARRLHNQGSPELVEGLHARCDGQGRPLCFVLTPGQAHDVKGFGPSFGMLADRIEALLADKGYDADAIRQELARNSPGRMSRRSFQPKVTAAYRSRMIARNTVGAISSSACSASSRTGPCRNAL
ncbi:transposase [Sphingomonas sp. Leaf208]|uniref:transposase n=1 Tax=Sphingomonas sp. Leaf208 TaxID=1735679 RepID=UPI0009E66CC4|nr:transposase [Sphingomonas sp. Leaf208]